MSSPSARPAALDLALSAERDVEAANQAFLRVERDLLEDTLSDLLRASARRHGIDL